MKVVSACVTAGLLLVAVPSAMAAPGDFANGGGQVFTTNISFAAHNDKNGDAKGHMNGTAVGSRTSYRADVTCLRTFGNRAVIGGEITKEGGFGPPPGFPVGSGLLYHVEDNGQPSDGEPGPDRINIQFLPEPPEDCTGDPVRFLLSSPFERGNILVRDAVE